MNQDTISLRIMKYSRKHTVNWNLWWIKAKGPETIYMSKFFGMEKEDKSIKCLYLEAIDYNKSRIVYEKWNFRKLWLGIFNIIYLIKKNNNRLVYRLYVNGKQNIDSFYKKFLSYSHLNSVK